jgi:TolB-like protein
MPTPPPGEPLQFAHYRVQPGPDGQPLELGRGAMGVTYKAFDERLRVDVALKVITPGQVDDAKAQALFLREARAAAQVHHPFVAGVVFLNDIPGNFFYAMEFVDGETVEAFVKRRGPLEVRLALRIILQAAQGLASAHERGLIHRDIKPANLMLAHLPLADAESEEDDELLVKVIDFGLAKSVHADDAGAAISLTGHGPVGTPNYMSPEQISPTGEPLDARTDIYSLGVTLWYLLMGRPPFDGTQFQVLSQQLQSPPPWDKLEAAGIPPDVEGLLKSMLAKRPEDRPASHAALIAALKKLLRSGTSTGGQLLAPPVAPRAAAPSPTDLTIPAGEFPLPAISSAGSATSGSAVKPARSRVLVASISAVAVLAVLAMAWKTMRVGGAKPAGGPPEKSVAVLPFENLSSDQENAFFANGMQDEILTNLARVADLKVISRSSVQQYKSGVTRNLKEIGQALGVNYVLEGSVQRSGGKVRVNAQLIDTRTDAHVWANRYDRDLADVFGIQTEVAENIATQLKARLSPAEKATLAERPTSDLQAYDLYLQAKQFGRRKFNLLTAKADGLKTIRMAEQATALDPNFLAAYVLQAEFHDLLYWQGLDRSPERLALAKAAIDQAIRVRPEAGETHLAQAKHFYWGYRDYDRAREHLEAAQRLLPNDFDVYYISGLIDRRQGRWLESNRNLERARELSPRGEAILVELNSSYSLQRMYEDAHRVAKLLNALDLTDAEILFFQQAAVFEQTGNQMPLREAVASYLARNPAAASNLAPLSIQIALGDRDAAAAARALAALPRIAYTDSSGFVSPYGLYAGRIARTFHDAKAAETAFLDGRAEAAQHVAEQPDDAKALIVLGAIDAGLGRRDDALRESRLACEMLSVERDALDGALLLSFYAANAAWLGEKDLAFELLNRLARIPSPVSYGDLKLNPDWDSLRGDPRFDALVAALAPAKK